MLMTNVIISRLALLAFSGLALTSCFGGGNAILGKWSLAPSSPDGCPDSMEFTASTMTATAAGIAASHDVTYKTDGSNVTISSTDGFNTTMSVNGNTLSVSQPVQCSYTRS
jgi:hypothetical protein